MLRFLRQLNPPFLKRLDHQLLTEQPMIWATRIHIVAFWSAVAFAVLAFKAMVFPIHLTYLPDPDLHFGFMMIPVALFVLLWGARVYQLKPDKAFGIRKPFEGLREQMIYLLAIVLMLSGPIAYNLILNAKIDASIADDEFIVDVIIVEEELYGGDFGDFSGSNIYYVKKWKGKKYIEQLKESRHGLQHQSTAFFLKNMLQKYSEQYAQKSHIFSLQEIQSSNDLDYERRRILRRYVQEANNNMRIISHIKTHDTLFTHRRAITGFLGVFLFVVLAFSVFQQASWQQFLLALGSAVLGGIVIGLGSELLDSTFRYSREEDWAMLLGAGLYFGLLTQIFGKHNSRRMAAWRSVAIAAVALATPVLLMCFFGWSEIFNLGQDSGWILAIFITIDISFLLWHGIFRHRMSKIQAAPTIN